MDACGTCGGGVASRGTCNADGSSVCVGDTASGSDNCGACSVPGTKPVVNGTWSTGDWGDCPNHCGAGTQNRTVSCDGASCGGTCPGPAPASSQDCTDTSECVCSGATPCGTWPTCSAPTCNDDADCDEGNVCTTDICNNAGTCSASCSRTNNTDSCNDGNACTIGDVCSGGSCSGGAPKVCNDNNICTTDSCNSATGDCVYTNNSSSCSDGKSCTINDVCSGGACSGTVFCLPNDCQTGGSCDASGNCAFTNKPVNTACGSGGVCDNDGNCVSSICGDGTTTGAESCDKGTTYVDEACGSGACVGLRLKICNDTCTGFINSACNSQDTGPCLSSTDCQNASFCDSNGSCPARTNKADNTACTADANSCTSDFCSAGACVHPNVSNGTNCSDSNSCTENDSCIAGSCGGTAKNCNDSNSCTNDSCNPATGACVNAVVAGTHLGCSGNSCTTVANTASACTNVCSSNAQCTGGAVCGDGGVSGAEVCDTGISYSNVDCGSGACFAAGDSTKTCNATCTGFIYGNCSTSGNSCLSSTDCQNASFCDSNGSCPARTNKVNGTACNDSNACTINDSCSSGVCTSGGAKNCDDSNACTNDSCDISTGCVNPSAANNTACNDSNACTNPDTCTNGVCSGPNICGGFCGNGVLDSGEQCDNGANNGACPKTCSSSCTTNNCGGITADIKANGSNGPIVISHSTSATLSWTSSGAVSCSVNPGGFTGISNASQPTGNLTALSTTYTLTCSDGTGGTASDSVTINIPPPPPSANGASCPVPGTTATLSWTLPAGYTDYNIRAYEKALGWPLDGCLNPRTICHSGTGTNYSFPSVSGRTYGWWAETRDGGSVSGPTTGNDFTCGAASPPTISLSGGPFSFSGISNNPSASPLSHTLTITNTGGTGSNLNWRAQSDKDWCYVNGVNNSGSITGGPLAKNGSANITVTVGAPSNVGTFNCTITVSDNGSSPPASNIQQTAAVIYTVTPNDVGCTGPSCHGGGGCTGGVCGGGPGSALTAATPSCGQIDMSWFAASGATSYNLYRNTTNTVPGAAYQTGIIATSYNDTAAAVGTKYFYWIEAINGALVSPNKVAANTNTGGGVAANLCPPQPPASGSVTIDNSQCGKMVVGWGNVAGATSYNIYRNTTGVAPTIGTTPPTVSGANPNPYTHISSAGTYYYWVSAVNVGGESAATAASGNPKAISPCLANLSASDKDIIELNGLTSVNPNPNQCGGTDPAAAGTNFIIADKLKFILSLCNDSNSFNTASNITITDTLTNLQQIQGANDFNIYFCTNYNYQTQTCSGQNKITKNNPFTCPPADGKYCVSGTAPNQTITINLKPSTYDIPQNQRRFIIMESELAVPTGFTSNTARFQNRYFINYHNGQSQVNSPSFTTPLLLFYNGGGSPEIREVAP